MLFRKMRLDWRYGVSELGIVVAGVLIALYADGLREKGQDRSVESTYIERLADDLRSDTAAISSIMALTSERAEYGRAVLDAFDSRSRSTGAREFVEAIEYAGFFSYPAYSRTTIDDVMSTGSLRLIESREVKEAISRYYAEIDWTQQFRELFRRTQGSLNDFIPEFLSLDQRYALVQESMQASCGPTLSCEGTIPWAQQELQVSEEDASEALARLLAHPEARSLYANMARIQGVHYANLTSIRRSATEALLVLERYAEDRQ